MIYIMSFIIAIIALGIVIFVHELGHMLAAKKSGIGVLEFSIGMGPKVWSKKSKETNYCIRAFPFGGFVKLAGMDDEDGQECKPEENFYKKPIINKFATIVAGSLTNIVFGFFVFLILYTIVGVPGIGNSIDSIVPDSPAEIVGLQPGDKILYVNEKKVQQAELDIVKQIHNSNGNLVNLRYERNNNNYNVAITPKASEKNPDTFLIGITLSSQIRRYNPIKATYLSAVETYESMRLVFTSLGMLISREAGIKDMLGPIGIVQLTSSNMSKGVYNLFFIIALISINLGVINLFPFPVLDGGHLVFIILEAIRRRPLNKKWETIINNAGAALLIALMAFIVINDVLNWKNRTNLFN